LIFFEERVGSRLVEVSDPTPRRPGRPTARELKLPSERDWERSAVLSPRPGPRHPELISDGGGLPFPPAALSEASEPLDPDDPAVGALWGQLVARAVPKRPSRLPWKWGAEPPPPPPPASLDGWRQLARTDSEVLFARGYPPKLVTLAVRLDARRRTWTCLGASAARPLRATRDGIRASSWRLDPTLETPPDASLLRVLVREQTFASGQRADGRVLEPDIYLDAQELVLTVFVSPLPGFQNGTRHPETPVRLALPHPVGPRRLVDGALVEFPAPGGPASDRP
jgi:hypothetical protein